jgi:hypothetical protein
MRFFYGWPRTRPSGRCSISAPQEAVRVHAISGRLTAHLTMAGPGKKPVQGLSTLPDLHWGFLRLWTGFELPSSWRALPCYGADLNRNILDFMK